MKLPSTLAEFDAYPPDGALPGSPRQCPLPLACHHLPKDTKLELGIGAHLGNTILNQPYRRRASIDQLNPKDSQLAAPLLGNPALYPPERPSHTHTSKSGFGRRGYGMYLNGENLGSSWQSIGLLPYHTCPQSPWGWKMSGLRRRTEWINPSRDTKFPGVNGERGESIFPIQLTMTRIDNHT